MRSTHHHYRLLLNMLNKIIDDSGIRFMYKIHMVGLIIFGGEIFKQRHRYPGVGFGSS